MYKLPVLEIIIGAFVVPWRNKQYFLYTLALPTLVLAGVWAAWVLLQREASWTGWFFYVTYFLALSAFAIACHCLILDKNRTPIPYFSTRFAKRAVSFCLWFLLIYVISGLVQAFILTIAVNIVNHVDGGDLKTMAQTPYFTWLKFLASVPGMYLMSRVALILPSIAINEKKSIRWSWNVTKNNGLRIFFLTGIFPLLISNLSGFLWFEELGGVGYALLWIITYLGTAIGVFALSLAYREFVSLQTS